MAALILYPAIDLKDGECVRLVHGEMQSATVFNPDPSAQAETFERQGFEYLHLVDLDGAFAGKPRNAEAVEGILDRVGIPVQLGGGIRDLRTIDMWLSRGVRRVILGTAAVKDPGLVREAARLFSGQVAVGIDARDGPRRGRGLGQDRELDGRRPRPPLRGRRGLGHHHDRYRPRTAP